MSLTRSTAHRINSPAISALTLAYWRVIANHRDRAQDRKRATIERFLSELEMDRILGTSEEFELLPEVKS